jgi:hypothetical protein
MTAELLASIAGIVLTLAFSYIPGLNAAFDKLAPTTKRLTMAVLLLVVAGAVFGLSCGNVIASVTCDRAGLIGLVNVFIAALIANQAAYALSPKRAK